MTEKKSSSAFLPILLLVVGVVIVAGVVFWFVPLVKCDYCLGVGMLTHREIPLIQEDDYMYRTFPPDRDPDLDKIFWKCDWCSGKTRIALARRWGQGEPGLKLEPYEMDSLRRALELREFLKHHQWKECNTCSGSGSFKNVPPWRGGRSCEDCEGKGSILFTDRGRKVDVQ